MDRLISTQKKLIEKSEWEIEKEELTNKSYQHHYNFQRSIGCSDYLRHSFSENTDRAETKNCSESPVILGIDIGTTTISAQLIAADSHKSLQSYSIEHHACIQIDGFPDAYAEDADMLISIATSLIDSLIDAHPNILSIGLTGQMHGVVCLNQHHDCISPLYSWQNNFGMRSIGTQTITDRIEDLTGEKIPSGYGINTCYALKQLGILPEGTAKIATIMDVLAERLCCSEIIITHPTNAVSIGLFDTEHSVFFTSKLKALSLPDDIVPIVQNGYFIVGKYRNIPVALPIGDNQAGVFASLTSLDQVLINVGTSSQITIIDETFEYQNGSIETRPFVNGNYIKTGSALCGGSAYAALADFVMDVFREFGIPVQREEIYSHLNHLAEGKLPFPLHIDTCFLGSRDDPAKKALISGLGFENFDLAHLTQGILYGIICELHRMYEQIKGRKDYIPVISGNAMRKCPALRTITEQVFGKRPLFLRCPEEAAYGAALYGAVSAGVIDENEVSQFIVYERK